MPSISGESFDNSQCQIWTKLALNWPHNRRHLYLPGEVNWHFYLYCFPLCQCQCKSQCNETHSPRIAWEARRRDSDSALESCGSWTIQKPSAGQSQPSDDQGGEIHRACSCCNGRTSAWCTATKGGLRMEWMILFLILYRFPLKKWNSLYLLWLLLAGFVDQRRL